MSVWAVDRECHVCSAEGAVILPESVEEDFLERKRIGATSWRVSEIWMGRPRRFRLWLCDICSLIFNRGPCGRPTLQRLVNCFQIIREKSFSLCTWQM